jgi:dsRNA-specific ribonuclease
MAKPFIKLQAAKQAISFPDFHSDELLEIALTDPCTLNEMDLSPVEQDRRKVEYHRLALLGDALMDAVLINYLYQQRPDLLNEDLDRYRRELLSRESLRDFGIDLGLPDFSSSWNRKNRKPPEEEPGTWGEMVEALVGVLFLDANRDFEQVAQWLCDRFLSDAITSDGEDDGYDFDDEEYDFDEEEEDSTLVTADDYAEMMGLSRADGLSFT